MMSFHEEFKCNLEIQLNVTSFIHCRTVLYAYPFRITQTNLSQSGKKKKLFLFNLNLQKKINQIDYISVFSRKKVFRRAGFEPAT